VARRTKIQREGLFGGGKSWGLQSACVEGKKKDLNKREKNNKIKNPERRMSLRSGQAGLEMRGGSAAKN
jgi:hypothetical protein